MGQHNQVPQNGSDKTEHQYNAWSQIVVGCEHVKHTYSSCACGQHTYTHMYIYTHMIHHIPMDGFDAMYPWLVFVSHPTLTI